MMCSYLTTCIALFFLLCAGYNCEAGLLFFADEDTDSIRSSDIDGASITTIIPNLVAPRGVAIDHSSSKLYWADGHSVPRVIQRANLDGSDIETLISMPVEGTLNTIALDTFNGKMYFADSIRGFIHRSNLDGSDFETIASGIDDPVGIAVDTKNNHVYWTGGAKTQRANLDGTGITNLLDVGGRDIELDLINGKFYLGIAGPIQQIRRYDMDGSNQVNLVSTVGFSQMGLDLNSQSLYWSDLSADKIFRLNLSDNSQEEIINTGLSLPRDIAVFNSVPEPSSVILFLTCFLSLCVFYRRSYF